MEKLKINNLAIHILSIVLLFTSATVFAKRPAPAQDKDFYDNGSPSAAKVELGRNLFYDKILSGNQNISCATCHHSLTDTGDGLSLPIGEGARGLGVMRNTGEGDDAVHERVPRNAPPVFNLGAKEFEVMFHDGRVQIGANGEFISPAGDDLPDNLDNILAVQAMFPVTSATEMAGQIGENAIADATAAGNLAGEGGVWNLLATRLQNIPGYVTMFVDAFDDVNQASDITYAHAANAIAAFEAKVWRATNSPFDRYLRGEKDALSRAQMKGMKIFYYKADCGSCHSGTFQTDHKFYSIAMPQIGGGKGDGFMNHDDFGRERVTADLADRYKFRTSTLRNIALTAPYGHDGAFNTLEGIVRHHLNTVESLYNYDRDQVVMPDREDFAASDFKIMDDVASVTAIADSNDLAPVHLSDKEIGYLVDFLNALTDPNSIDLRTDVPKTVPSGLSIVE